MMLHNPSQQGAQEVRWQLRTVRSRGLSRAKVSRKLTTICWHALYL